MEEENLIDSCYPAGTEKVSDSGNTEKLIDIGNTEKLIDTGNTEKRVDTDNIEKQVDTGNIKKLGDNVRPESTATTIKRPLEDEDSVSDVHVQLSEEQIQLNFRKPNMAWIKPQYILPRESQKASQKVQQKESEPPLKKQKTTGRNRNRPVDRGPPAAEKLCPSIIMERNCFYGTSCKFCHDVVKFMANKPADIGDTCYVFENYGRCSQSIACRYGSKHIDSNFKNIVNKELHDKFMKHPLTINFLEKDVQKLLWKRKYDFSTANGNVKKVQAWYNNRKAANEQRHNHGDNVEENGKTLDSNTSCETSESSSVDGVTSGVGLGREREAGQSDGVGTISSGDEGHPETGQQHSGCVTDEDLIKLRPMEKKKLNLRGKLYLAPLTTVGNLPFRRVCKGFGADVTCSEMAVATKLLQANQSEWALLKRHRSEDLFGVQVCGSYPDTMTRCAQLLTEVTTIDFVDINCGCPIDMVYKRGEGAALMSKPNKLEQIVKSMTTVLDVPLTLKMRTGISSDKDIAHTLIPKLRDWGVSEVTLHGRSREQRYTRLADWDYINRCAQLAAPMPVFGNGDVLSYEEYYHHLDTTAVGGIMIARGALIKPWIFTEIKERRHWDIAATERLDILKDFVNYGLEHWGSDQQGVETVRKFLLEQLSFSYRYIPVGLLERLPQQVNERPPCYRGRNDLETLLSSPDCADWIKISEMLLGPTPANFSFLPKHRANSYQ
ncbi:tRNA-dihydrouridine(47) synthase [NAD(P)(+)]-like [Haliotis asinina]|uniref:tRNA-dihydrouridine(47) synthase [NAD(P)(+)]-like n=1 Tax=Haliotis asinina TaxID=109174 RepID=UPI0035324D2B